MFDYLKGVQCLKGLIDLFSYDNNKKIIKCAKWLRYRFTGKARKVLTRCLLSSSQDCEMVVGKGNQQAMATGKEGLSRYLGYASTRVYSFYRELNPKYIREPQDYLTDEMLIRGHSNIFLIGGPIANEGTLRLGGYDRKPFFDKEGQQRYFPLFNPKNGIALGFDCGDESYGMRNGSFQGALRYEEGEEREGAVFRIRNARNNEYIDCEVAEHNGHKFIAREGLLITKIPNPYGEEKERSIVIIGGAHGFSSEAFASNLFENLKKLNEKTARMKYYQIYIPCAINHDHVRRVSLGRLEWEHPHLRYLELSTDEL